LRQLTEAELKVISDVADMLIELIEDEIRETEAEAEAVWCAVWGRVTQRVAAFGSSPGELARDAAWHARVEATDGRPPDVVAKHLIQPDIRDFGEQRRLPSPPWD
jgi:hypothetical protein